MTETLKDTIHLNSIRNILIIRFSAMGDIILITPLLRWMKQRFTNASLDVLVKPEYAVLLENNPAVGHVLTLPENRRLTTLSGLRTEIQDRHYDAVVDLQANWISRWLTWSSGAKRKAYYTPARWARFWLVHFGWNFYHQIEPVPLRYLRSVASWGVEDDGHGAELCSGNLDAEDLKKISAALNPDKMIVIAPGAGRRTKRWPAAFYRDAAKQCLNRGFSVVLVGGEGDRKLCGEIAQPLQNGLLNLCGDLGLMETAALLKQSCVLLSNDTGVMHMAGAVGTPVIAVFGPTTEHLGFFPFRSNSIVIEHPHLSCRPCSFHGTERCPKKHFRCMREIKPDQVMEAMDLILTDSEGHRDTAWKGA